AGHVRRAGHRVRADPHRLRFAGPSVQPGTAGRVPVHSRAAARAHRNPRRATGSGPAPERVPVPPALPVAVRAVRPHRPAAVSRRQGAGRLPPARATGGKGGMTTPLIETRALTKHFKVGGALSRRTLHAVDNADFTIGTKEIVALAGESGSGKSTIARLLA